jgi:hypothetical protein
MRKAVFVAVAAAVLLLAAIPAHAKVAGEATISGPGLGGGAGDGGGDGSITLGGGDGGGWAAYSGLLDTARAGTDQAPAGDLGPRYRVVLDVRQPPQPNDVVQYLYPFAESGPVLYTPPGQRLLDFDAPSGWWEAGTDLMAMLDDAGFPDREPAVNPQPPQAAPEVPRAAPATPGVSPLVWATVALAGLLLVGAVAARRRLARLPAR